MTSLAWTGLAVLVIVVIASRFVSRQLPRPEDAVSEQWLKENRYQRDGDKW